MVYLAEAADTDTGHAIIVRAGSSRLDEPDVIELPLLHPDKTTALNNYLDAYAAWTACGEPSTGQSLDAQTIAAARDRWRLDLGLLCEWAWPAVMEPLLTRAASGAWIGRPVWSSSRSDG